MDLLQNPFYILNASPHDNRRRIMELADERSLLLDSNECMAARSELTNPRKRLSAEVAWLPGIGPKRAEDVLSLIGSSPTDLLAIGNLSFSLRSVGRKTQSIIARANLLAAGLARLFAHSANEIVEWILEIAWAFEDLAPDKLSLIINEERIVSGFPKVSDLSAVATEIQERRRYYCQVIKSALNNLSSKEFVEAVTITVESATNGGKKHGPIIIADLVDWYELEVQGILDKEEVNIKALVQKLRGAIDAKQPDSTLAPMVNQLIKVVKDWDTVAQPIQVNTKSKGLDHDANQRVASLVLDLAEHTYEHDKLDFSQQLANMLQEVFAEVVGVAERTAKDADALDEMAEQRVLFLEVSKIKELITQIKADVDGGRSDTYVSPKVNQLCHLVTSWKTDPKHDVSQRVARLVRCLAIDMFEHGELVFTHRLTKALWEVFYDAGEISDRIANDIEALKKITSRIISSILDERRNHT